MKFHRFMLFVVLMSLSTAAFAQSEAQKPIAPKSEAQKSFDTLKTLAGEWEGQLTVDPPQPDMNNGKPVRSHVTMRDFQRERLGARDAGSRNSIGLDEIRSSGHDALSGY